MSWALITRPFWRRVVSAFVVFVLWAAVHQSSGETNSIASEPTVGRNADGHLEVFRVDTDGQLRHSWQKISNGDWSSWSTFGGPFEPNIAVVPNARGELEAFAIARSNGMLWHSHQARTNSLDWSGWAELGGPIQTPLAANRNTQGCLHVFAVDAQSHGVRHCWQVTAASDTWSAWSDLGGNIASSLVAVTNLDGRLELFGMDAGSRALVHCWQRTTNNPTDWSAWATLGGPIAAGFAVGRNVLGRLEVFAVNPSNHTVERICQASPGTSESWTGWEDFGGDVQPGLAVGQSADGRLEVLAVERSTAEVLHRWENFLDGSDVWSVWTGMGAKGRPPVAVGQNEDGNLEIFAADPAAPGRMNHRRQISRASDWLDWSSLEQATLEYSARTWQTDEGLPLNNVQALAQTVDGYLWVGTSAGLARFDGMGFTTFDTNNTPQLKNSSITALCADAQGGLWIGTDGGGLMRLKDGRFSRYTRTDGLAGDNLRVIYRGRDGSLWLGTATGMSHFSDGVFTNFATRQGLSSDVVRAIYEDRDGSIWIATGAGLNRLRGQSMDSFAMPNGLPNDSVRVICQDRGGRIWIGSNNGMLWYSYVWTNFYAYNTRYGLSDTFVSAICEDREGNLWVGTYSGLNRFHQGRFYTELNNEGAPFDRVNTLLEDQEGNLWVGSREGLVRLTPKAFSSYGKKQGLSHNNAMSVLEDRSGSLWVGTWGGGLDQMKNERVTAYALTNRFAQGLVLGLYQTRDGSIWFGADFDGGLTRVNGGEFKHYTSGDGLLNAPVRVLQEDRAGVLWIGTDKGLCRFKDGKFSDCTDQPAACRQPIHALYENARGDLWVGTDAGLICRRNGETSFSSVDGLGANQVLALHEDKKDDLWIGTSHGGLYRLQDGRVDNWTSKAGLCSDEIFEILEDESGWLWMSCSRGVFRARAKDLDEVAEGRRGSLSCIVYGKHDGLESIQCNGSAKPGACKTQDGRLWFATSKGLAGVNPAAARINALPPPVSIEQLVVDRRPLHQANGRKAGPLAGSLVPLDSASELLEIAPGRGELEFHYTALSLVEPDACRFRYKLEGADTDWVEAGPRRTAHYNNIYPGNYVFRVTACNEDGVWNEQGASLALMLEPHIWQTWWFRSALAVLVVGFVGGIARYTAHKRLQRKLEILEQRNALEKERGRIAKDIHDDLGSSLTRIMMLGERAEEGLARQEQVGVHVGKIVTSARKTVQALDEIVWAVNPENDTLEGLVEYLSHYANEFFENSNVSCRLEIPVRLPNCALPAEFRHGLFLVVKEAFNNILKHAAATQVSVAVGVAGSAVRVIIEDNGCGFDQTQLPASRKGNGLGNMRKRIEALGGQITFTNDKGTKINITVPLPSQ